MQHRCYRIAVALGLAVSLQGCVATKVASTAINAPVKVVWKGGKVAGKAAYHTGKGVYHASKSTGEAGYYVGSIPVQFTHAALKTTSDLLTITTQVIDLTGTVLVLSKTVAASTIGSELRALDNSLQAAQTVHQIISVTVDIAHETNQMQAQYNDNPYN